MNRLGMGLVSSQLWAPEDSQSRCQVCAHTFNPLMRRRSQCRVCGNCICRECMTTDAEGFPDVVTCLLCQTSYADPAAQAMLAEPSDAEDYGDDTKPSSASADPFAGLRERLRRLGIETGGGDAAGAGAGADAKSNVRPYSRPLTASAWYFGTMAPSLAIEVLRRLPLERGTFFVHRRPNATAADAFRLVSRTPAGVASLPIAVSSLKHHPDGGSAPSAAPGAPWCALAAPSSILAVRRPTVQDLVAFYTQQPHAGLWLGPPCLRTPDICPQHAELQFGRRWRSGVLNGGSSVLHTPAPPRAPDALPAGAEDEAAVNVDDDVDPDAPPVEAASTSLFGNDRYRALLGRKLPALSPFIAPPVVDAEAGEADLGVDMSDGRLAASMELLMPDCEAEAAPLLALKPGGVPCPQCQAPQLDVGYFCVRCGLPLRKPPPGASQKAAAAHFLAQGVPRTTAALAALDPFRVKAADVIFVKQVLGQGTYGKVQLAVWREKPGDEEMLTVAAKRACDEKDPVARANLLNEAAIMTVLCPPREEEKGRSAQPAAWENVVQLFGAVIDEGPTTLLLEYMANGPVLGHIEDSPELFPASGENKKGRAQLMGFAIDAVRGLQFLHSRRVLHRDVAARNFLLDANFRCKISDFGKAKRIPQGVSSVPLQDEEALAVNWLAPEVLQRRLFFLPSETWSFGVAVWELFSHGALPYGHLYSSDEMLSRLQDNLRLERPVECDCFALLEKCWAQSPRARPSLADLESALIDIRGSLVS